MAPGGGLRGTLLGSWAKPAARGCGGLATGGGGNLATATILTTHPSPPVPFNACGWPFSGQGRCGGLATCGYPCSHVASCQGGLVRGAGWRPEAPGLRWASCWKGAWRRQGGGFSAETLADRGSQWPYLPPRFPLPRHLYIEEVDIWRWARDVERKSQDRLRLGSHWVLKMPPLWDLPMPWQLSPPQEANFWKGWDVAIGEDLELGRPPPGVQLEEAGWRIPWMPAMEPAKEGSPFVPLGPGPMEVDGTGQVPGDGATVGEATDSDEIDSSLTHDSQS